MNESAEQFKEQFKNKFLDFNADNIKIKKLLSAKDLFLLYCHACSPIKKHGGVSMRREE
jgi:predicted  nucleic acid-binding Zn ribbon protein